MNARRCMNIIADSILSLVVLHTTLTTLQKHFDTLSITWLIFTTHKRPIFYTCLDIYLFMYVLYIY